MSVMAILHIVMVVNLSTSEMSYNPEMEDTLAIRILIQEDNMTLILILRQEDMRL